MVGGGAVSGSPISSPPQVAAAAGGSAAVTAVKLAGPAARLAGAGGLAG